MENPLVYLAFLLIFSIAAAILSWTERERKWLRLVLKIGCVVGVTFTIMLLAMFGAFMPHETAKETGMGGAYVLVFFILPLAIIFIISSRLILKHYRES